MTELALIRTGSIDRGDGPVPVWCAIVRTAAGYLLFDTGLHPVHIVKPEATFGARGPRAVMREEDRIVDRLASLGVTPAEISVVVNSHLHFDHAGNNGAFPKATFIVQAEHLAHARGRPAFPGMFWDLPSVSRVTVSGAVEIAPGVRAVPTPGHVPGHQSILVELSRGRVALCGDADPAALGEVVAAVRAHAEPPLAAGEWIR